MGEIVKFPNVTLRRQAEAIALSNWDGKIDPVAWQKARAEQEAENLEKSAGIPVVFPVND